MSKKNKKGMEECSCQCHTFARGCYGFGCGDKNCCDSPHTKIPAWETRINPQKKSEIIEKLKQGSRGISSEDEIMAWPATMEGVPEHIKSVLTQTIAQSAKFASQFDDPLDSVGVQNLVKWVFEVLEEFL